MRHIDVRGVFYILNEGNSRLDLVFFRPAIQQLTLFPYSARMTIVRNTEAPLDVMLERSWLGRNIKKNFRAFISQNLRSRIQKNIIQGFFFHRVEFKKITEKVFGMMQLVPVRGRLN